MSKNTKYALGMTILAFVLAAIVVTLVVRPGFACTPSGSTDEKSYGADPYAKEKAIQARHECAIMRIRGVNGIGISQSVENGRTITVFAVSLEKESAVARRQLPKTLEGIPVIVEVTGKTIAQ